MYFQVKTKPSVREGIFSSGPRCRAGRSHRQLRYGGLMKLRSSAELQRRGALCLFHLHIEHVGLTHVCADTASPPNHRRGPQNVNAFEPFHAFSRFKPVVGKEGVRSILTYQIFPNRPCQRSPSLLKNPTIKNPVTWSPL